MIIHTYMRTYFIFTPWVASDLPSRHLSASHSLHNGCTAGGKRGRPGGTFITFLKEKREGQVHRGCSHGGVDMDYPFFLSYRYRIGTFGYYEMFLSLLCAFQDFKGTKAL